jgi:hypothetical protein
MQTPSPLELAEGYLHFLDDACPCSTTHGVLPDAPPIARFRSHANNSHERWVEHGRWMMQDYRTGKTVAEHVRYLKPDGHKTYVWRRNGTPGLKGLPETRLPLYGGYAWLQRALTERTRAIIVEGEKAADALLGLELPAVGIPLGAPKVPDLEMLEPFREARLLMWPDADEAGERMLDRLGEMLSGAGLSLEVVRWPEAPSKGDAADFRAAGGTPQQAEVLIARAESWRPHTGVVATGRERLVQFVEERRPWAAWEQCDD